MANTEALSNDELLQSTSVIYMYVRSTNNLVLYRKSHGSKEKYELLQLLRRVEKKINNDDLMIRNNVCCYCTLCKYAAKHVSIVFDVSKCQKL